MQPSRNFDGETLEQDVFTVSRLNRETKDLLAGHFPAVWVEGEISNLAQPSSGHIYFSLKDAHAQVRCAMFRLYKRQLSFTPDNGAHVLAKAQVSLYEARGDFQLIVERMEEAGEGALRRAFEALKLKLQQRGLFDSQHKQAIPVLPNQIGIITSPSGAAIHDIVTILKRRFASIPVVVYPVGVQGADAGTEISNAIDTANQRAECDVLIVARGGGSLEDLWAFNEEVVAEAIFKSRTPIVTGIGHEIDFSIADFVADRRCATPSEAAESVAPNQIEWLELFTAQEDRLVREINTLFENRKNTINWITGRLNQAHPGKRLQNQAQRLDDLEFRANRAVLAKLGHSQLLLKNQQARLRENNPAHRLGTLLSTHGHLAKRLNAAMQRFLEKHRRKLAENSHALDAVSPLATLSRGYAIVTRQSDRRILTSSQDVNPSESVETRLAEGRLICRVEEIHET